MEQNKSFGTTGSKLKKNNYTYLILNILLALILPLSSIFYDHLFEQETINWELIGKWFIFWAVGIRLFTAGISQASNPSFTARIFRMKSQEAFVIIRELGFANISMGVLGILSVINYNWRIPAAIAGGLFLGLSGIQHLFKKRDSRNETIAMMYDLFVMIVIAAYLIDKVYF